MLPPSDKDIELKSESRLRTGFLGVGCERAEDKVEASVRDTNKL